MKKEIINELNELSSLVEEKADVNLFYTSPGRIKQWKELQDQINQKIVSCLNNIINLIK